jgi:hypothetical protein
MEERLTKSQSSVSSLVISFFFHSYIAKVKLTKMPPAEIFTNLKCTNNPRNRYCPSLIGFISVGEIVYLLTATSLEHLGSNGDPCTNLQMLKQFLSTYTFGKVTHLYTTKPQDPSSSENDIFTGINLYLNRDVLPASLGRFNIRAPQGSMLVQADLTIEGCLMEKIVGSNMVIDMDHYDRLIEGLLHVYFIASVYQPMNPCITMKSYEFHLHSSSDLFRKAYVGFVSHPELHYNHLVEVSDAACKMMYRVAAHQQRTNWVHIDMMPCAWIVIKRYLLEETKEKMFGIQYDNGVKTKTGVLYNSTLLYGTTIQCVVPRDCFEFDNTQL